MNKQKDIEIIIEEYFKENSDLIITQRIKSGIASVILSNEKVYDVSSEFLKREVNAFLEKDKILDFVKARQPLIERVSDKVIRNVEKYFSEHCERYSLLGICRKSNHLEDGYLYEVIACNGNQEYACWTSWNETTQSLNYGHYGLGSMEEALEVVKENFYDITDEVGTYGIERSFVSLDQENTRKEIQQSENRETKISSHRR